MNAILAEADLSGLQGSLIQLQKRALLQTNEKKYQGLYLIKQGKLRLYKINDDGKQFTLDILGKGDFFGEAGSFALSSNEIIIECIEDTDLVRIDKKEFEIYLMGHPHIAIKFLGVLSSRLQEREFTIQNVVFSDVKERILNLLRRLSIEFGLENGDYYIIDIPLTHQEIANMIGTTRESVSNLIRDLVRKDYIQTGRRSIKVSKKIL